jgi:integrase/recombinase XerD
MKQAKLLTELDFKRLTAIIDSLRYPTRNHTAVALSFYAGLRAIEISAVRVGDVFDAYGKPKDTIYLSAAQTKGNDSCTVFANKRLRQQLARYAAQHPKQLLKPAAPLIFSAKGGGFSPQTIVNLFQRLYKLANIAGASSHSGRRQFVTNLADMGINMRVVQELARHRNLGTTQKYAEINDNKLRAAVELLS